MSFRQSPPSSPAHGSSCDPGPNGLRPAWQQRSAALPELDRPGQEEDTRGQQRPYALEDGVRHPGPGEASAVERVRRIDAEGYGGVQRATRDAASGVAADCEAGADGQPEHVL